MNYLLSPLLFYSIKFTFPQVQNDIGNISDKINENKT